MREKLDNSYVYTQNERIPIAELGGSCSGQLGANLVKIEGSWPLKKINWILNISRWLIKYVFLKKRRYIFGNETCNWPKEEIDESVKINLFEINVLGIG